MTDSKPEVPAVELKEEILLAAAVEQTGLNDWGDVSFRQPLRVLVDALEQEARLHHFGRFAVFSSLLRMLTNRLKVQHDLTTRPEINQVEIPRPLFVVGFPRTGTTLLHGLLACDPSARALLYWECLRPSPPPEPSTRGSDPRIAEAVELVDSIKNLAPELLAIHGTRPRGRLRRSPRDGQSSISPNAVRTTYTASRPAASWGSAARFWRRSPATRRPSKRPSR